MILFLIIFTLIMEFLDKIIILYNDMVRALFYLLKSMKIHKLLLMLYSRNQIERNIQNNYVIFVFDLILIYLNDKMKF